MSSDPNRFKINTLLFFTAIPIIFHFYNVRSKQKKDDKGSSSKSTVSSGQVIRPPFPPVIRNMLSSCQLAYLSTVEGDSSHLSLMRFTYMNDKDDGEVVVMTTRKNTKKFTMLEKQNGVALLIHDFPQFEKEETKGMGGVHSITLNGRCTILKDGDKADVYRAKHLEHNPDYPQFIIGPDIVVLCVKVTSARICNVNDEVTKWSVEDGMN